MFYRLNHTNVQEIVKNIESLFHDGVKKSFCNIRKKTQPEKKHGIMECVLKNKWSIQKRGNDIIDV